MTVKEETRHFNRHFLISVMSQGTYWHEPTAFSMWRLYHRKGYVMGQFEFELVKGKVM